MSRPVTGLPPGRIKGTALTFRAQNKARDAIDTAKLVERLRKHAVGEDKMSPSQIRAAEILLNKTLPNLTAATLDTTIDDSRAETMSDAALIAIAGGKKG